MHLPDEQQICPLAFAEMVEGLTLQLFACLHTKTDKERVEGERRQSQTHTYIHIHTCIYAQHRETETWPEAIVKLNKLCQLC